MIGEEDMSSLITVSISSFAFKETILHLVFYSPYKKLLIDIKIWYIFSWLSRTNHSKAWLRIILFAGDCQD